MMAFQLLIRNNKGVSTEWGGGAKIIVKIDTKDTAILVGKLIQSIVDYNFGSYLRKS